MLMMQYLLFHLSGGRFAGSQRGATLIEYVLIVAVIAIAVFAAGNFGLAHNIRQLFLDASDCVSGHGC